MTWMIIRLILSLAFVGGVLVFAARVAKRRGIGQSGGLIEVVVVDEDFGLRISEIVTDPSELGASA